MKRRWMILLTSLGALLLTGATLGALAVADVPPNEQLVSAESEVTPQGPLRPVTQREAFEASETTPDCEYGYQQSGAQYYICVPEGDSWNGDLLVYAHGYMAPDREVEIPQDQMVLGDISITETVTSLGYAFATTSYYTNGLAVLPALSDLLDLVNIFTTTRAIPNHIYLTGVSEGGLITVLSVEQHPDVYDGGLAMCGPYGDFRDQINHYGDFRVVFDYFFPNLMPGEPLTIPATLMEQWESGFFTETILPEITEEGSAISVTQLLTVTSVSPYKHAPPTSTDSIEQLLWYNVFATNDGVAKLGGQPFDNEHRWYSGSNDDARLNAAVERFSADPAALEEIAAHYQTTGKLSVPLVTLHTTGDEGVPYKHAVDYQAKTIAAGSIAFHEHMKVERHGHCNFTNYEVIQAFFTLVSMVENPPVNRIFLPSIFRTH